jgi:hypothetical protein
MKTAVKKTALAVMAMMLLAGAQAVQAGAAGEHDQEKAKEVTLKGEVLDMFCYMKHPESGQGPDHAKCATSCINKGLPIGFLAEDGSVYLIIGKDHEPAAEMVADFTGKQSLLTGTVFEHHGVKSIEIASIKAAE